MFLNDYTKHIVEINGQKTIPTNSEILTYFHNFILIILFLEGQKFKMSVDFVAKKS